MTYSIEDLRRAFVDTLTLDPEVDIEATEYSVTPGWDSIAHMALVAELEDRFDVMLDTDDVLEMSSFVKSVEILGKHDVDFE